MREISELDWSGFDARESMYCVGAISLCLAIGIICGAPRAGALAASGAMTTGFGAFHRLQDSRTRPMLFACMGIASASLIGALIGHYGPAVILMAGLSGFVVGLLQVSGPDVSWVGMQCAIFMLVYCAHPQSPAQAIEGAAFVLMGGLLQTGIVVLLLHLPGRSDNVTQSSRKTLGIRTYFLEQLRFLFRQVFPRSEHFPYAMRLAVVLAVAAGVSRLLTLRNGYWIPMTALIVLKPDFYQTASRGAARVAGTLIGAGLTTLLVVLLRPGIEILACLVVGFAYLCYVLLRVNYALFAICITTYVVCLLAIVGLPEKTAVLYRAVNTIMGGGIALLAYPAWPARKKESVAKHLNDA